MVFSKHIIAAFAAATSAYAASCKSSDTLSIQNQGDITSNIGSCSTYTGDVEIQPNAGATLDFGSVEEITGTLSMSNDDLASSISLASLTRLGNLSLKNLTALGNLDLSSLETVGELSLVDLAALSTFKFGQLQKIGVVTLQNVQISDLSPIASASEIDGIVLSTNQYLQEIAFDITEVGIVDISPNNYLQGQSISFPNLQTATSMFLRNATSVSVPSLRNVSETLGLYGNTFSSFGISNLTWVGALVLEDNSKVTNFSFPRLAYINGSNSTLDIENNTALTNLNGFQALTTISNGGVILAGNIRNVSLPALRNVAGALTVDTTSSDFDCDSINNLMGTVVKGAVDCKSGDATPTGSSGASETGSGDGSSSSSAATMELPSFLTTGAFAALLAILA